MTKSRRLKLPRLILDLLSIHLTILKLNIHAIAAVIDRPKQIYAVSSVRRRFGDGQHAEAATGGNFLILEERSERSNRNKVKRIKKGH